MLRNRLKEIRMKEYMMSSKDFAHFIGVDFSSYSNWETNKSRPKLETAFEIAKKLNKHLEDIWYLQE